MVENKTEDNNSEEYEEYEESDETEDEEDSSWIIRFIFSSLFL